MNEIERAQEEYRKVKIERATQLLINGDQLRRSGKELPCYNCNKRTTLYLVDNKEVFNSGNDIISLCRTCSEILKPSRPAQEIPKERKVPVRTGETFYHNAIKQAIAQACKVVGYTTSWRTINGSLVNACNGAATTTLAVNLAAPSNPYSPDIYFKQTNNPWFKLSNTSFNSLGSRSMTIPQNTKAYDGDDTLSRYLIIDNPSSPLKPE